METPKRMTWEEIVETYPDQWVGLVDIDWKNMSNVRSAVVKYTDKGRDELTMLSVSTERDMCGIYTTPNNYPHGMQVGIIG